MFDIFKNNKSTILLHVKCDKCFSQYLLPLTHKKIRVKTGKRNFPDSGKFFNPCCKIELMIYLNQENCIFLSIPSFFL